MGKKHQHEDHVNHEAWAIPYGDLVTLLLAFFVVMYAVSSVNEGKYRVMADAMSAAFGGSPRTITPVQLGKTQLRGSSFDRPSMQTAAAKSGPTSVTPITTVRLRQILEMPTYQRTPSEQAEASAATGMSPVQLATREREQQLNNLGSKIQDALTELVRQKLVTVRRGRTFLEVEIQSDILFASGAAEPSPVATATVRKLAMVLRDSPNSVRVEGYTDDRPIRTPQFQSNWELSSARAAGVVHVLINEGVGPGRLAVVGYGEYQPIADNATPDGRNANRRVMLVILAAPQGPDAVPDSGPRIAMQATAAPSPPASIPAASAAATPLAKASAARPGSRTAATPVRHPAAGRPLTSATPSEPRPGAG